MNVRVYVSIVYVLGTTSCGVNAMLSADLCSVNVILYIYIHIWFMSYVLFHVTCLYYYCTIMFTSCVPICIMVTLYSAFNLLTSQ